MDQKILCVDDSRHIRQLVTRLLKSEFEVFEAKDGEEALGFLEGFIFDVIVTDLNMPNMDGLTFLSKMRQLSIKTPTLVFSGESNPKVIRESLRLGADDFIAKPCDLELLKQKIIFVAKQKCIEIQEGHGELEIRDPPNKPMLLDENATVMAESSGIAPAPALVGAPKQVLPEEGSEKSQKKKTAVQISDPFGFFLVQQTNHPTQIFELKRNIIHIGRSSDCDLVLADTSVSRVHASLEVKNATVTLLDRQSSNGTVVNGEKIDSKVLTHDAQIRIGRFFLGYKIFNYEVRSKIDQYRVFDSYETPESKDQNDTNLMGPAQVSAMMETLTRQKEACLLVFGSREKYQLGDVRWEFGTADLPCQGLDGRSGVIITWVDTHHVIRRKGLRAKRTLVNGVAIKTHQLEPGDTIEIASGRFTYRLG